MQANSRAYIAATKGQTCFVISPSFRPEMPHMTKSTTPTGGVSTPINPPAGCRFHPRCPFAEALCATKPPALRDSEGAGHKAACHMAQPGSGHSRAPVAPEAVA